MGIMRRGRHGPRGRLPGKAARPTGDGPRADRPGLDRRPGRAEPGPHLPGEHGHLSVQPQDADRRAGKDRLPRFRQERSFRPRCGRTACKCHLFDGYWEDIGTIKSFFEANLQLADRDPPSTSRGPAPRSTRRARFLPPSRIDRATIRGSLVADGCPSRKGPWWRTASSACAAVIGRNVTIRNSILMGDDFYELPDEIAADAAAGITPLGVGAGIAHRRRDHRQELPHRLQRPRRQRARRGKQRRNALRHGPRRHLRGAPLDNPMKIRHTRKNIAKLQTELVQRKRNS